MQSRHRILCTREFQVSIADSVHKLLKDQIEQLGLSGFYSVQQAKIIGANGTEFIFAGLHHNITSIKSMEGVTRCWVEEAETCAELSWSILVPTIRAEGSEIWVSFNPREKTDPTYRRFVESPPPGALVVQLNWQDNEWFPLELSMEKDYAYSVDPEAASWVWGGECRRMSNAQVLRGRCVVEPFEIDPKWDGPYQGADFGFAADPSTLVRCYVAGRVLYISHESYGIGIELDNLPALYDEIPGARKLTTRADNSRPETISHLCRHGYPEFRACEKGAGSVEDGVEYLRSFERIVIHQRCKHVEEESRLWSFKQNSAGDVLPDLIDKHNHCWDAIRYALEPLVKTLAGAGILAYAKQQLSEAAAKKKPEGEVRKTHI